MKKNFTKGDIVYFSKEYFCANKNHNYLPDQPYRIQSWLTITNNIVVGEGVHIGLIINLSDNKSHICNSDMKKLLIPESEWKQTQRDKQLNQILTDESNTD